MVQISTVIFFVLLAGLFAGTETGIYRLSRTRLRLGKEQKKPFYRTLHALIGQSYELVLTSLVGTNLCHYIVTSAVTYMVLKATTDEHKAELYATILMTPVLFIFAELIPKNIYYYRADNLMTFFAPVILLFHRTFILIGIVPLLGLTSKTFSRLIGLPVTREAVATLTPLHHFRQIIDETRAENILSPVQSNIMHRLANIQEIPLSSVMVPIEQVQMVELDTDKTTLLNGLWQTSFTRLPVYYQSPEKIVGFINIYETLAVEYDFNNLRDLVKPIPTFSTNAPIIDTLNMMRRENHKIALIVRTHKRPAGIITLEDLVEELTGELAAG